MFTSKKAQYLNGNFDKISPITNIESLYFEQAELIKDVNNDPSEYIIKRQPVAKYLPVKMNIYEPNISTNIIDQIIDLGSYYKDACINTNLTKIFIPNPANPLDNNSPIFEYQQYKIDSSKYVNIQNLLKYYTQFYSFSTSIGIINSSLDNMDLRIDDINNTNIHDTSLAVEHLINELTSHIEYYIYVSQINGANNGIYNLIYQPSIADSSCIIKVQCISTNTIKNIVSLDTAFNHSNDVSVEQWIFHYDTPSNKMPYLKDEHGNEGNFDFRIAHLIHNNDLINSSLFINNKLYFDPDANIKFEGNGKFERNEIYNSTNITFTGNASNNIIVNCNNIIISGSGNKIYNSSNVSTMIIKKSNNIIINCNNSSVLINGNSNYIMNSSSLNVSLGNNNIIIGDEIGCLPNVSTLENMKLFFSYSTSTALAYNHTNSYIFYGGIGNDISVYSDAFSTITNKY